MRLILTLLFVGGGYLSYNYAITKKNGADISLRMDIVQESGSTTLKESVANPTHWNLKHPIVVTLKSKVKIRSYHIKATTSNHLVVYEKEQIVLDEPTVVNFELPKPTIQLNNQELLHYKITVRDWSYANFFNGNITTKTFNLTLDTTPPKIQTIAQSSSINYGGSALVVFKVEDESLDKVWLSNGHENFRAFAFVKHKYYAAVLPWSIHDRTFNGKVFARDKAYNVQVLALKFIKNTKVYYPKRVVDLSKQYSSKQEALRNLKNLLGPDRANTRSSMKQIIQHDLENTSVYDSAGFNPFNPLGNKKPRILFAFGAQKHFVFKKEKLDKFLHLGVDLSSRHSKVLASNNGKVILEEEVEGYGKSVLVSYDLGVYAFYGSLSEFVIKMGDLVEPRSVLGLSGRNKINKSDHIHFEVLVQGVLVRPREWMDQRFIQKFNAIIQEAKSKIQAQEARR